MEGKPLSVLDASVVLKWFVQENGSDKSREIQNKYLAGSIKIIVPDLLLYEISNVLRYNKSFSKKEIDEILTSLSEMGIEVFPINYNLIKDAVNLAYKFDITVYDACYVALALTLSTNLITADAKLLKKADIPEIELL
ncbi:hypothetical protein A3J90_01820 [candidate division WOR-1 bacterium RIFOXYC2_FULL_37_10]|uniref:PIN domain-containing protein n=1 Tax=candidate division WOR-1 bacterium RIFOXYB2_FULL_37_13 TaxID=1802579 RepID=A0A1F4SNW6_UNCSA|nr:MAG: hypothetical protein A2310_04825 [candidate division WOR-1 bacterium RIFOXYB2_FULL_37_13]OGC35067.1 MAG: hypothetical protein A3J90_01820 [candidate division WOR-1 bacterium RIFOXYC2_FULL_37_10]